MAFLDVTSIQSPSLRAIVFLELAEPLSVAASNAYRRGTSIKRNKRTQFSGGRDIFARGQDGFTVSNWNRSSPW